MTDKINGRTPEEIKLGLECCADYGNCSTEGCPYEPIKDCGHDLYSDALAYIQQLERERDELLQKNQQLERERDAAVEDMKAATLCGCHVCKHYYRPNPEVRKYACRIHGSFEEHDFIADDGSIFCGAFEWRGVQEVNENGKESS